MSYTITCDTIKGIQEIPELPYVTKDFEFVVENGRTRIYWNYSFPTLKFPQSNRAYVFILDHYKRLMNITEFLTPVETNIARKGEEKRNKYISVCCTLRTLLGLWF